MQDRSPLGLICRLALAALCATVLVTSASAQSGLRREHVEMAGWTGSVIDGVVEGRDTVLYEIAAAAGDQLTVRLHSPNTAAYFNVYAPGRGPGEEALAVGSLTSEMMPELNEFVATVPAAGTYTVSVYLFRAAARAGEVAPYSIEIDLLSPSDDADSAAPLVFQVRTRSPEGHLNVHTDPSTDAPRIGRYPNGTILRDIGGCRPGDGRDWCEVMAEGGGLAGYVAREFLAPVFRRAGTPTAPVRSSSGLPAHPPSPTIPPAVSAASDHFHVHLDNPQGHLGVHAGPSVHTVRVGRLTDGSDLRNIGGCVRNEGRTWCDVMQAGGGVSGWVAAEYLRDGYAPAAHVTAPAAAPMADFADGLSGGPDYWRVSVNRSGSSLRMHSQPSTDAPIVSRLPDGSTLRNAGGCRMSDGERWCFVSSVSGHATGWVAGEFLVEGSAPGIARHIPAPPVASPAPLEAPTTAAASGPQYDASGTLACVRDRDAAEAQCSYGAVHEGSGNGYVLINWPDGGSRAISFEGGMPVYFDQSQADGDAEMTVTRSGDDFVVFIGESRFVIPAGLFAASAAGTATQLPLVPPPAGPDDDALVAGTEFNATGQVSCIRDQDAAEAMCDAGVTRDGDGSGFVTIFWPDGGSRVLFFEDGTPVYYDESEADDGAEMTVTQVSDTFVVFVGAARFVIPEFFLTGG
ncbi:hypothetical protein HKCCE3408_09205 [Rhodobacterales bacterium HKCCE3408]|nr:hypothetical protein [Rhodobacterales bacterium HKCCE3408]